MTETRILAAIPARAGSKGILNKNVRIVAGRPHAYYAIKNALDSELVTDVVITDFDQVRISAEQMGASSRTRAPGLCADDVALTRLSGQSCSRGHGPGGRLEFRGHRAAHFVRGIGILSQRDQKRRFIYSKKALSELGVATADGGRRSL